MTGMGRRPSNHAVQLAPLESFELHMQVDWPLVDSSSVLQPPLPALFLDDSIVAAKQSVGGHFSALKPHSLLDCLPSYHIRISPRPTIHRLSA
jgi:hypothetical protein